MRWTEVLAEFRSQDWKLFLDFIYNVIWQKMLFQVLDLF